MIKWLFLSAFLASLIFFRVGQFVSSGFADLAFGQINRAVDTAIWRGVPHNGVEVPIKLLETAITIWPDNRHAWRGLGYIQISSDNPETSIGAWKNVDGMEEELTAWGKIEEQTGNISVALAFYDRATLLNPEFVDPWFYKGRIYEKNGDNESAAIQYQTGLQRSVFRSVGQSDLYFRLGKAVAPNTEDAIDLFDRAIVANDFRQPQAELQARYARGAALRWSGREAEAANDFAWVLARQPDHYWALVHQGALQWQLERDAETAEKLMLQAASANPELTWAYLNLGQLYEETGQDEKAVEMYRLVIRLNANDETALERLRRLQESNEN